MFCYDGKQEQKYLPGIFWQILKCVASASTHPNKAAKWEVYLPELCRRGRTALLEFLNVADLTSCGGSFLAGRFDWSRYIKLNISCHPPPIRSISGCLKTLTGWSFKRKHWETPSDEAVHTNQKEQMFMFSVQLEKISVTFRPQVNGLV